MEFKIKKGSVVERKTQHGLEQGGGVEQKGGSDQGELEAGKNGDGELPDIAMDGGFVGCVWIIAWLIGRSRSEQNFGGAEECAAWATTKLHKAHDTGFCEVVGRTGKDGRIVAIAAFSEDLEQRRAGVVAGATKADDALSCAKEGLKHDFGLGDLGFHLFDGKGGQSVGMMKGVVRDLVSFFNELVKDLAVCRDVGIFSNQKECASNATLPKQVEDARHGMGVDGVSLIGAGGGESVDIVVKTQRIDINAHRTQGLGGHTPPPSTIGVTQSERKARKKQPFVAA